MLNRFKGVGTQRQIDQLLCLCTIATCLAYAVVLLFTTTAVKHFLDYLYLKEMFRRVAYITAIFRWVGTAAFIKQNWAAGEKYVNDMPFELQVIPSTEPPESGVLCAVLSGYPFQLRCYDKYLEGYVELRETFMDKKVGCVPDTLFSGVGFLFLSIFFMWTAVKGGNLYARYFPPGVRYHWVALALVWLGLFSPLAFGLGMYGFILHGQRECVLGTVKDNLKRSVTLFGDVLLFTSVGLNGDIVNLFNPVFEIMNKNFIEDGSWGVAAVNNYRTDPQLYPPIPRTPQVVLDALLERSGNMARTSLYFPNAKCFLATFPMSSYNRILVLVQILNGPIIPESSAFVITSFLLLTFLLLPLFVYGCIRFPYDALGRISCDEAMSVLRIRKRGETWNPWEWRASRFWPLWKVFHVIALMGLMVGASVVFIDQLVAYYGVSSDYNEELLALVEQHHRVQEVGDLQLRNMEAILFSNSWYAPYVQFLLSTHFTNTTTSSLSAAQLAMFYQSLVMVTNEEEHEGLTAAWKISGEPLDSFPILMNSALEGYIQSALEDSTTADDATTYEWYAIYWDMTLLHAILINDAKVLEEGDPAVSSWLMDHAESIGLTISKVVEILMTVLYAAKPYTLLAYAYTDNVHNPPDEEKTLFGIMNSDTGRLVVAMENEFAGAIENVNSEIKEPAILYIWDRFNCVTVIVVCLAFGGWCLLFDFYYMATFFGFLYGREKKKRAPSHDASDYRLHPHEQQACSSPLAVSSERKFFVPTGDRTAPSPYFSVNHTTLSRTVCRSYFLLAVVTICVTLAVIICFLEAQKSIQLLLNNWESNLLSSMDETKKVFRACPVALTVALWLRTLFSLNVEDEKRSITVMYQWNKEPVTTYVGPPPELENNFGDRLSAMQRPISTISVMALLKRVSMYDASDGEGRKEWRTMPEVLYKDFQFYTEQLSDYYDIDELVVRDCIPVKEDVYTIVQGMFRFFYALILEGRYMAEEELGSTFRRTEIPPDDRSKNILSDVLGPLFDKYAGTCGLSVDILLYLQRVRGLAMRTWSFPLSAVAISSIMAEEMTATRGLETALRRVETTYIANFMSIVTSYIPWITILAAVLCTPFAVLIYMYATRIFRIIYHP